MRTAEDEVIDLGLNRKKVEKIENKINTFIENNIKVDSRKEKLELFYALQLIRQTIADNLKIPYT